LQLAYERVPVDIFAGETLTPEFALLNPQRTTPVLELPNGRYLVESNAILFYLASRTSFLPPDPLEQASVLRWLIFEQTDVMPFIGGLRFRLQTGRLEPGAPAAERRLAGAHETLKVLEDSLETRRFLTGDGYTIADIATFAYTHLAAEIGIHFSSYPRVDAWMRRVMAQPHFVDDLAPYPANARPELARSIYDAA
jgi:glutathione S-transferase